MSTFFHPITIIGPNGEETVDALVDTDVMFATVTAPVLERLGVQPLDDRLYRGHPFGQVQAKLAGQPAWVTVVFADSTEQPRIGRHTLDSFILDVDPVEQTLVPKLLQEIRHF